MSETTGLALCLIILLIISFIACAISALFNACLFCGMYYMFGKRKVYAKGYLFYLTIYACFSIVTACITFTQFFRYHLNMIIIISSIISVLFGTFLIGKIFDNADAKFVNLMFTIILFAFGIPAFLGALYIITLPLVPFVAPFR